ncbi:hypothetical protein [Luteimonas sp. RC10]|uniref:hypothetical protein n=1 Tax=Luteimonas sp. RC10 TaxID=2587035 RepID=UPI00161FBDD3|nr:hypothetical protein [Luteimonas sp. RC10]MBB3344049.1 hypothetical protein [Luteimonas sp. RC10]
MHRIRTLTLLGALCCGTAAAQAESASACPQLPVIANVQWSVQESEDFVFCRAIEFDTQRQPFAVAIGRTPTFQPRRGERIGHPVRIDGLSAWWHAPQNDLTSAIVRETLLELASGHYAHIIVRADDPAQLARTLRQVEQLEFADVRLGN